MPASPLNWREGLRRAWWCLSGAWLGFVLLIAVTIFERSIPSDVEKTALIVTFIVGPPMALALVFRAVLWTAAGFRAPPRP